MFCPYRAVGIEGKGKMKKLITMITIMAMASPVDMQLYINTSIMAADTAIVQCESYAPVFSASVSLLISTKPFCI